MLHKNLIKDDNMNLEDGQILFTNQEEKELLKDLPSAWSSFLSCFFFHVERCFIGVNQ